MSQKPRKRRLNNEELALAMELRTEGISWKIIAEGLGVTKWTLRERVKLAKEVGMIFPRKPPKASIA